MGTVSENLVGTAHCQSETPVLLVYLLCATLEKTQNAVWERQHLACSFFFQIYIYILNRNMFENKVEYI